MIQLCAGFDPNNENKKTIIQSLITRLCSIVWFQKISIHGLNSPSPWNFQFSFILSFRNFGGISNDLPWGGYGHFLELHIYNIFKLQNESKLLNVVTVTCRLNTNLSSSPST